MPQTSVDAYAYARQVLLPALGLQNHPFVIHRPGTGGTASQALKVTVERGPGLLVRFFGDRARAWRCARALRLLEELDLPAPRLKHADLLWINRFTRNNGLPRYAVAETWIDGVRALEAPDPNGTAMMVADLLARFHANTRTRWGRAAGPPEMRGYAAATLALVALMIRDLTMRRFLSPAEASEIRGRFNRWKTSLMGIGTFHLVTNDANRRNFIVTPEKALTAIDVQRISYEPCAEEVANALYHFCRNDEALASRFLERYLHAATESCRMTWARSSEFFKALNTLKRMHRRSDPGRPPGAPGPEDAWRKILTTFPPPPRVWPEPGSEPPLIQ